MIKKSIKAVWDYIKVIWEGGDGKPSYRRVAQLIFLLLIMFLVKNALTQTHYGFLTLLVLLVAFLLLAKLITSQQIIEGAKLINFKKVNTPTPPKSSLMSETDGMDKPE